MLFVSSTPAEARSATLVIRNHLIRKRISQPGVCTHAIRLTGPTTAAATTATATTTTTSAAAAAPPCGTAWEISLCCYLLCPLHAGDVG